MARISGTVVRYSSGLAVNVLSRPMERDGSSECRLRSAAFRYTGRGGSLATAENRVMAVADGRLYNADELDVPADVSLAQQLIILY